MTPDNLNEFIKKQVEHLETPTDPDLLWQKIEAKQKGKKKRKRRFFFLWFFGGVFLLGGLALMYIYQFSNTDNFQSEENIVVEESQMENNLTKKGTSEEIVYLDENKSELNQEKISDLDISVESEKSDIVFQNKTEVDSENLKLISSVNNVENSIRKSKNILRLTLWK